jgi:hypothetical protein
MYNCKLINEAINRIVVFKLYEPNIVVVETSSKDGDFFSVLQTVATEHDKADAMKEEYLKEGFTEV